MQNEITYLIKVKKLNDNYTNFDDIARLLENSTMSITDVELLETYED